MGLAVVLTAEFMDLVDATIVTVALPSMAADLGMTSAQVQWTLAGYTLAMGAGLITGGRVGDLYGRRRVFLAGVGAGTLFAALTALAPNPGWLMVMRILTGVAAAFTVPLVIGMIRANFPDRYRPAALGVYGATLGLAAVVGPILGGALVDGDLWGAGLARGVLGERADRGGGAAGRMADAG
ncbi:MFS transporter [Jiangella muralis]|uniref:MFS transporter n=1 Tax=Jiangella muralis TaxID=702383 RepID=UPI001969E7E6|nr:MFS transporter [Jiangella muralis]